MVRHQGNQLMQTQAWDPAGRLQEQLLGSHDGKSTLLKRQYQYDAVGQLTDILDTRRGHLAYQYDPVGRLLQATSRLGVETFAFDPAGNLLDENAQQLNRPLESDPRRNKRMDNLLREYAGTHYQYDERGNLLHRLHKHSSARYQDDPRSGSGWNRMQRAKRQRELGCGYTLYGWDGDTLAWESSPPQDEAETSPNWRWNSCASNRSVSAQSAARRALPSKKLIARYLKMDAQPYPTA